MWIICGVKLFILIQQEPDLHLLLRYKLAAFLWRWGLYFSPIHELLLE